MAVRRHCSANHRIPQVVALLDQIGEWQTIRGCGPLLARADEGRRHGRPAGGKVGQETSFPAQRHTGPGRSRPLRPRRQCRTIARVGIGTLCATNRPTGCLGSRQEAGRTGRGRGPGYGVRDWVGQETEAARRGRGACRGRRLFVVARQRNRAEVDRGRSDQPVVQAVRVDVRDVPVRDGEAAESLAHSGSSRRSTWFWRLSPAPERAPFVVDGRATTVIRGNPPPRVRSLSILTSILS